MEEEKNKDDGSLSFLNIPRDKNSRHFNCPEITQQKLTNLTFWVIDYMDGVSTKFGKDRALVMIKDDRLLMLLDEIIDSAPGVPIGNYLSQYLANLYLAYLDHEIKEIIDIRHYIRYADDMTFFHHDKCFLRNVLLPWLIDRLAVLKLELKGNYQIFKIAERRSDKSGRGVDFVGFVFYKEHIRIRKRTKQNLCRAAARLNKVPNISLTEYKAGLAGWLGWIYDSDSKHLAKKILKPEFYEAIMERHNAA